MLPFTHITEGLLPANWIKQEYPILLTVYNRLDHPLTQEWEGFIKLSHAIIKSEEEYFKVKSLTKFDNGNTKTNSLYWIATRPQLQSTHPIDPSHYIDSSHPIDLSDPTQPVNKQFYTKLISLIQTYRDHQIADLNAIISLIQTKIQ